MGSPRGDSGNLAGGCRGHQQYPDGSAPHRQADLLFGRAQLFLDDYYQFGSVERAWLVCNYLPGGDLQHFS
ncbi:hypothetical protein D3C81_1391660 [compost metagenome]